MTFKLLAEYKCIYVVYMLAEYIYIFICIYFMLRNQYIWIFAIRSQMYTIDTYVHLAA